MPSDESKKNQIFQCKDCGEEIPYIPDVVQGIFKVEDKQTKQEDKVAYLECSKGHIHPYKVKGG